MGIKIWLCVQSAVDETDSRLLFLHKRFMGILTSFETRPKTVEALINKLTFSGCCFCGSCQENQFAYAKRMLIKFVEANPKLATRATHASHHPVESS